jgi:hypothetical protein
MRTNSVKIIPKGEYKNKTFESSKPTEVKQMTDAALYLQIDNIKFICTHRGNMRTCAIKVYNIVRHWFFFEGLHYSLQGNKCT